MNYRVQHRRLSTAGATPAGILPGEIQPNLADGQLYVGDAGSNPHELIPVTAWAATAYYASGALAVYNSVIYRALAALTPQAWTAANWVAVSWQQGAAVVTPTAHQTARSLADLTGRYFIDPLGFTGAANDGKKAILNASVAVGGTTLTVSLPAAWAATTAYTAGQVATNNGHAYSCAAAGVSGTVGPTGTVEQGAPHPDGTAKWFYIGPASLTANVFAIGDVGKTIAVSRQDVWAGFNPWWNNSGSSTVGHATIAGYISPTSVTINLPGSVAPAGYPTFQAQSWPYSSTPSTICWGTDNTPAFNAAITAARSLGRCVVRPTEGVYCFASPVVLQGSTVLEGGPGVVLLPLGVMVSGNANVVAFMCNANYLAMIASGPSVSGTERASRLLNGDVDIVVRDLTIDMSASGQSFGGITMRIARNGRSRVQNIRIFGSPLNPYEGPTHVACDDYAVTDCTYLNAGNAFMPWAGETNGRFQRNTIVHPANYSQATTYGVGGYGSFQINSADNPPTDNETASFIVVSGNTLYLNGATQPANATYGITLFPDGPGSSIRNVRVHDNTLAMTGANNSPVSILGGTANVKVSNNTLIGADGARNTINVIDHNGGRVGTNAAPTSVTSVFGTNVLTIVWTGHGYDGSNVALGQTFFTCVGSAEITVGGTLMHDTFPVLAVLDANTFTVETVLPASSSQTVAWPGGYFQDITSYPMNIDITGNQFVDCAMPGGYVISCRGIGCKINFNDLTLSAGTAAGIAQTGNYLSFAYLAGVRSERVGTLIGNTAPPGVGSLPGSVFGNNRVAWVSVEPPPIVMDFDDEGGVINVNGSQIVTGSGVAPVAVGITIPASPWTWTAPSRGFLVIEGGVVTGVATTRGGVLVHFSLTTGLYPVAVGDPVTVIYSTVPTSAHFLPL